MGVTDEELQAQQERVESLRVEVAEVNTTREASEREAANQVTYDQLKVEEDRLTAALEAARNAGVNTANADEYPREGSSDGDGSGPVVTDGNPTPDPAPAPEPEPANAAAVSAALPTSRVRLGDEPPAGGPAADQNDKEN